MRTLKKIFSFLVKNANGASMIEMVMGAGLLGGLALFGSKSMIDNMKMNKAIEGGSDIVGLVSDIRNSIANADACGNSFNGNNATSASGLSLRDASNNIKYSIGAKITGSSVVIQGISLDSSFPEVGISGGVGSTYLVIDFKRTSSTPILKKYIKIMVNVDGSSNITSCRSVDTGGGSFWSRSTINYDDIYYQGANVGVGTNDPKTQLDVNGAVKIGATAASCSVTIRGAMKYDPGPNRMYYCDGTHWREIRTILPYHYVNTAFWGEPQATACARVGSSPAASAGFGTCASGERRPGAPESAYADDIASIAYIHGTWGAFPIQNALPTGDNRYCYHAGQVIDNDPSDRIVAWLCVR